MMIFGFKIEVGKSTKLNQTNNSKLRKQSKYIIFPFAHLLARNANLLKELPMAKFEVVSNVNDSFRDKNGNLINKPTRQVKEIVEASSQLH